MRTPDSPPEREQEERERSEVLEQWEEWLEKPMLVLGLAWLVLLILELTRGLTPLLEALGWLIWGTFVIDFGLRLVLAPRKLPFLRQNWLTVLSLALPALRIFRLFRVLRVLRATRAARGVRLVRVLGSLNRGMRALGRTMARRGLGYAVTLTTLVTLAGAAGMYAFERDLPQGEQGLDSYGTALWWTAMLMTTMGSEYWPKTAEGRLLCLVLALYAFAVFGYLTAVLASFFIGRDAESPEGELAGEHTLREIHAELRALREEVRALRGDREPPREP